MAARGKWPKQNNLGSSHAIHTVNRVDKRKRAMKLGFLGLVALLLAVVSFGIWLSYSINVPVSNSTNSTLVTIKQGMSVDEISRELASKQIIRDAFAFRLYARIGPARGQLKPGPYQLKPSMSTVEIIDYLAAGKLASRQVTIAEGKTIQQISETLAADSDFAGKNFATVATTQPDAQRLLIALGAPAGTANPEGLFAPDSYTVLKTDGADVLAAKMLKNFEDSALPLLTQAKGALTCTPHPYTAKLTPYQRLTLASMVEKEASRSEDRAAIAGVFYNRLAASLRLESDPTINYVTGKTVPTAKDLTIDSPYNTYKARGLPPTPTNNPSLDAITSTICATSNDYIYFIGGKDKKVYFAKTYAEHMQNIEKYLK
ncbi:MAG: endolytic transglycosylase MltG [Candidatus Saccharibacteria bacterium]